MTPRIESAGIGAASLAFIASSMGGACLLLDNLADVHRSGETTSTNATSGPNGSNGSTGPGGTPSSSATGLSGACRRTGGYGGADGTCEDSEEACGVCADCVLGSNICGGGGAGGSPCKNTGDCAVELDCGCPACKNQACGFCKNNGVCSFKEERCDCMDCAGKAPWCL